MTFNWLKRYMPRGLFGRALLILIFPVVTLQLLVSVVFIQRHFEGVTEQMSRGVAGIAPCFERDSRIAVVKRGAARHTALHGDDAV